MAATETSFHVDTLDLYSARARAGLSSGVGRTRRHRRGAEGRSRPPCCWSWRRCSTRGRPPRPEPAPPPEAAMTAEDRAAALALLRDARSAGPHHGGLRRLRPGRRGHEQAGRLPRRGVAQAGRAAGGAGAILVGCGQIQPDGCGAGVRAGGRAGALLGDHRPGAVLHGARRPEAPHPRHLRGGGRQPCRLCAETAAVGRLADHRQHRQGSGDRCAGHAGIPGGGAGDAVPDHHGDRARRGAAEPLPGAVGG